MERLQKVIAQSGYCSRRKAEELISKGRIFVNGKKVTELGTKVSKKDKIEIDGVEIEKESLVYFVLNKPAKYITTTQDEKGRNKVTDLITDHDQRVYPVGRLDWDTTGVLLMTNDGSFCNMMIHPSSKIEKEYIAKVKGLLRKETSRKIQKGVDIGDYVTAPCKITSVKYDDKKMSTTVRIIITEGQYRQVKRMFSAHGHEVLRLKRVRVGSITADGLKIGEYRRLKPYELKQLKLLSEGKK